MIGKTISISSYSFLLTLVAVTHILTLEVAGFAHTECSPFPCDEDRTCGLSSCAPSGNLIKAFDALKTEIVKEFGDKVSVRLTLLDQHVPDYIRAIYEREHPAIPMIILEGNIVPVGRISWPQIREAITDRLSVA